MKLLVDIGNTRLKWAFGTAAAFVARGECQHDAPEGPRALLDTGIVPAEIRIANVAGPQVGARMAALLRERFGVIPVLAWSAASGAGVRSGYSNPAQLGVDRWLAVCAAFARHRSALCVVDAGTATTIDVLAGDGGHQGGLILPGIELMQSSLLRGTGDLARLSAASSGRVEGAPETVTGNPLVLGRDTAGAIRGAAVQATASLVLACVSRLGGALPGELPRLIVLTGGAAPLVEAAVLRLAAGAGSAAAPVIRLEHRPDLVLEGLALDPPCFRGAE